MKVNKYCTSQLLFNRVHLAGHYQIRFVLTIFLFSIYYNVASYGLACLTSECKSKTKHEREMKIVFEFLVYDEVV